MSTAFRDHRDLNTRLNLIGCVPEQLNLKPLLVLYDHERMSSLMGYGETSRGSDRATCTARARWESSLAEPWSIIQIIRKFLENFDARPC